MFYWDPDSDSGVSVRGGKRGKGRIEIDFDWGSVEGGLILRDFKVLMHIASDGWPPGCCQVIGLRVRSVMLLVVVMGGLLVAWHGKKEGGPLDLSESGAIFGGRDQFCATLERRKFLKVKLVR